jgi:putative flippase GtrA
MDKRPGFLKSLLRYNVVAVLATAIDFLVLVVFTELFNCWYLLSAFLGAVSGGVTSFFMQRNWTFMRKDGRLSHQAIRFILVWIASILLNTLGLFLVVECLGFQYIIAKIIVATSVNLGFNFLMHKYYIFK